MRAPLRLAVVGTTCLLMIPALTGGAMLQCQEASAYLPLDDWTMPYVEHLIATRAIADPSPLTRPLRRADVVHALEAADTARLSLAAAATLHRLRAALASEQRQPHVRATGGVGAAVANYARRDPLAAIDSTGLLLSANPYGLDHVAVSVGSARLHVAAIATQLDDRDSLGSVVHRFMMQHRLVVAPGRWSVALWEGSVLAGRDRSFEPWYLNALTAGILEQWNNGGNVNSFVGLDFEHRAPVSIFGQLMLDDIQVDRGGATDQKPVSYALTAGVRGGIRAAAWRVYYTRVTNLTYRNEDSLQV